MVAFLQGANFRNLPGVIVGPDNVAKLDPSVERVWCKSGKPLVLDNAKISLIFDHFSVYEFLHLLTLWHMNRYLITP